MSDLLLTMGETLALLTAVETGPLRHAHDLRVGVGGAESNVAIGVRRLGGRAAWIGRVGDDELGELVLRTLRAEGVDVSGARVDARAATSLMLKEQRTATTARVTYYRDGGPGSRLSPADVDPERVAEAGVLHVTGITLALSDSARAAVHAAARSAREAGVTVSLDVNYRSSLWGAGAARAALDELLPFVDVCFVGHGEAVALGYDGEPEEVAGELSGAGPDTVVVKRGSRGAIALADGSLCEVAPFRVPAIDPVGAGDAFAAGYLADLLAGRPLDERLRTAAACGAYAVTARGDWEALPSRADLELLEHPDGKVMR
ncbi:MAG TPA: sugar kinase [Capillimicrobium sp.]|nr:sugar kinase [Capillimicrobium sp.]